MGLLAVVGAAKDGVGEVDTDVNESRLCGGHAARKCRAMND